MNTPADALRLRIYLGESDRHGGLPLHEAIVLRARELHLAGATVWRGAMGFGASSRIHTSKILRLSADLPVVVEIVDLPEKIRAFLPVLEGMLSGGLVTTESVCVVKYQHSPQSSPDRGRNRG
jgi:PII-like signaling protein